MDHIISLQPPGGTDMAEDWYKLHVLLSRRFGPRVDADGNTLWTFAADPRMPGTPAMAQSRFVMVRTNTPELDASASEIAAKSYETYFPGEGERVRFDVACSSRGGRPGLAQRIETRFKARQAGIELRTASCPGNIGPQIDRVTQRITDAGLDIADLDNVEDKVFRIYKGRRHEGRAITVVGLFSSGVAVVRDVDAVHAAIRSGIGRDRGFGFGILLTEALAERAAA
jgi:CRISPR associated protein.